MISCVIPTRNEAGNLPHVMSSLGWTDEVIVVDMESEDGTPEVARSLGATVISVPRTPHFDSSRQVGLQAARNEWVLSLDADEMVQPQLAETLARSARDGSYDVILIPRLNFKLGRQQGGGLWPDYQRRFYRRGAVEFLPTTHDYLKILSEKVLWLPAREELALFHFNYLSVEAQIEKLNRYTTSDAQHLASRDAVTSPWLPAKAFTSLYFKHRGWRDSFPGLWWCGQMAFYHLTQRQKRLEIAATGTASTTEEAIASLNRETSDSAARRGRERVPMAVRLPSRIGATLVAGLVSRRSSWNAAYDAFRALTIEAKVWERTGGRVFAEGAQQEGRALVMRRWRERVG